jgi:hypothetical protein
MTNVQGASGMLSRLAAPARSPQIDDANDVYGWLVGSWRLDVVRYRGVDVSARGMTGEVHFAWVLEGRAIQDVWIMPAVADRSGATQPGWDMYGTTLRIWDPAAQAWRIRWINPVTGHEERQTGRRIGSDIVQIGARADGTPTRWRFTEIAADSFRWTGEVLEADGQTWKLEGEFRAQRTMS